MSHHFRVTGIILGHCHPFSFIAIDLTDPVSGEPLSEVCLLGANGAGKEVVLSQLYRSLSFSPERIPLTETATDRDSLVITCFESVGEGDAITTYYQARKAEACAASEDCIWLKGDVDQQDAWHALADHLLGFDAFKARFQDWTIPTESVAVVAGAVGLLGQRSELQVGEEVGDLPSFFERLNEARDEALSSYLQSPEQQSVVLAEVFSHFEEEVPDITLSLGELWQPLLAPVGLAYGVEEGLTSTATGQPVPLSALGGGLQILLHRFAQVRERQACASDQARHLLVEEPEIGLHPELRLGLVDRFRTLETGWDQLFISTNDELIAAQFAPTQRVILRRQETGEIEAARGTVAKGSSPNQMLRGDFDVSDIRRQENQPAVNSRYEELKQAIHEHEEADEDELADLIDEVMSLRKR